MDKKGIKSSERLEVRPPKAEFVNGKRKAEIENEMKNYKKLGSVIF